MQNSMSAFTLFLLILNPFTLFYCACFMIASWRIVLRYLHFFQQEEYDSGRFLKWWIRTRSFERRASLLCIALALGYFFAFIQFPHLFPFYIVVSSPDQTTFEWINNLSSTYVILFGILLFVFALIAAAGFSNRPGAAKKPLAFTSRAKRIFTVSYLILLAILFIVSSLIFFLRAPSDNLAYLYEQLFYALIGPFSPIVLLLLFLVLLQSIPISLAAANTILNPMEASIQRRYINEAKDILKKYEPDIIGITGSYGKTSIKHILSHILSCHAQTLATPGSVNTQMGITRVIRERLRSDHRFFIVEMGAYRPGSIQKLCELTSPKSAIVTGVGLAHLERFKTEETIARAKSELPLALPAEGIAVLNGDDPHCRNMAKTLLTHAFFYGRSEDLGPLDCRLVESELTAEGMRCVFEYRDKTYDVTMPLYGEHQALNAAGAFLLAAELGAAPITITAALKIVPPIDHRLVVTKGADGITWIDDAYNSNPTGFLNALDTLRVLPGTNKILITPGMVELGGKHAEEHARVAEKAAQVCDAIALVAPKRIPELREGLLKNGFPEENLHEFDTLNAAKEWLDTVIRSGAVVLFENDLPDLYESPSAFTLLGGRLKTEG